MRILLFSLVATFFLMVANSVQAQFAVPENASQSKSELTLANQSTATLLNALSVSSFTSGSSAKREKAMSQLSQSKQLAELKSTSKSALALILPGKWKAESDRVSVMQKIESARSTKEWGLALTQLETALRADAFNGFWKTQRNQWLKSLQRL